MQISKEKLRVKSKGKIKLKQQTAQQQQKGRQFQSKSKLPKGTNTLAETIASIVNKSTAMKKEAFRKEGIRLSPKKLTLQKKFSSEVF